MQVGCTNLAFTCGGRIIGIDCSKGRGIILPGGKLDPNESFHACAMREFYEETLIVPVKTRLITGLVNTDGFYVYAFHTKHKFEYMHDDSQYAGLETREGKVVLTNWNDLCCSAFGAYYRALFDVWQDFKHGQPYNTYGLC